MAEEKKQYEAKRGANIWLLLGFILFCVLAMAIYLTWDFVRPDLVVESLNFAPNKLATMLIALLFGFIFLAAYALGKKIFPETATLLPDKIVLGTKTFLQSEIEQVNNTMVHNKTVRFVYQGKKQEFCFKYFSEDAQKQIGAFFARLPVYV